MDLVDFKKSVGLQLWAKRWTTRLTRSRLTSRHASSSWSVGFFVWIPAMELHEEKGYDLLVHDFRTKEQTHSDNVDRQGRWISKGFFQDLQYPIALSFFPCTPCCPGCVKDSKRRTLSLNHAAFSGWASLRLEVIQKLDRKLQSVEKESAAYWALLSHTRIFVHSSELL